MSELTLQNNIIDNSGGTSLSKGNKTFRNKNYKAAMAFYIEALKTSPGLTNILKDNIALTRKKHLLERQTNHRLSVAVCGWELSHNAAGRVYTLAKLYEAFADVEIIGSHFPGWGREIWEPIRETSITKHSFVVEDESQFLEQGIHFVSTHPYDLVHLSKPRASNIILGLLYKLVWGSRILVDIDDEELAFVNEKTPISIDEFINQNGKLPDLRDLAGKDWTRLAVGMAKDFDGITVSNPALQRRYGGEVIRHARDEKIFHHSPELKKKFRERFGIPINNKVVLFFGTPREHKGLLGTAKAIALLNRPDVLFLIVGDFPKAQEKLKDSLQQISGLHTRFIGNQPVNILHEVIALGDVVVIFQDIDSDVSQFQIPAKLSDSLAVGHVVLANHTPPMSDVIKAGAVLLVTERNLVHQLSAVLDNNTKVKQVQEAARHLFRAEFSQAVNIPRLKKWATASNTSSECLYLIQKFQPLFSKIPIQLPDPHIHPLSKWIQTDNLRGKGQPKIAILVHIYYLDLWPEIASRLRFINYPFDLIITTTIDFSEKVVEDVHREFPSARIKVTPNNGMDILPFLAQIPALVNEGYLAVCKLHTKKGEGQLGSQWLRLMLDSLIGNDKTIGSVIKAFQQEANLALVGPACLYQSAKTLTYDNDSAIKKLQKKLPENMKSVDDWGFFAGTSFWAKPSSFAPLAGIINNITIHDDTGYQRDGQVVHALERLFGLLPHIKNQQVGLIHFNGNGRGKHALQILPDPLSHLGQSHVGPVLRQFVRFENDNHIIKQSGLFHQEHYLAQQPGLAGKNVDLIAHYLLIGRFQMLRPHPDFDPVFYKKQHPNKITAEEDTFVHYLHIGAKKDLLLRTTPEKQRQEIPSFRYQVLNTTLIDWQELAKKRRDNNIVSIIIPVLDQSKLTRECIQTLYSQTEKNRFELIVVDNGSEKETQLCLNSLCNNYDNFYVIRNKENYNFALGCNLGFSISNGANVIFLNNDTVVTEHWLKPLLEPLDRPEISAVQPRLIYLDGKIQCMGVVFSEKSVLGYPIYAGLEPDESWAGRSRAFQAVTGACMALRANDFIVTRGFDTVYINGQEDIDLCLRLNEINGRHCWYSASSIVYHKESQSEGRELFISKNREVYVRRWKNKVRPDDFSHYEKDGFLVDSYQPDRKQQKKDKLDLRVWVPKLKAYSPSQNVSQGRKEGREPLPPQPPEYVSRYEVSEPQYVPRLPADIKPVEKAVKVICFYLPQFHPIPENDVWWGEDFTEWTNVKPSKPQFEGHYQPHVPDDFIGYYNLLDRHTQAKQIELAKQYGIEGFCFYLYWFSGKRLLEKPVDNYLNDPTLDLPFCVCWANENWSRRWDGLDSELLMIQHYSNKDDINFIANAAKYLRDSRYIRVNDKPLLLVYRPNLVPSMRDTALRWRDWCRENGIGEIYLAYPQSFERVDPAEYGFDAAVEFPPNKSKPPNITHKVNSKIEVFQSMVFDWRVFLDRSEAYQDPGYTLFRGATPSWDNTARKNNKGEGTIFHNNCPTLFEKWLTNAFVDTLHRQKNPDEQIVFINAWNEWAEGAHLEPDQRYGYAWLEALRRAHRNALTTQPNELKGKTLLFVDYALPMYDRFAGSRTNYMYLLVLLKMGLKVMYLPVDFKHIEPYSTELKNLGVEILAGDWFRDNWKEWFKEKGSEIDYAFLHKPDPAIQFLEVIHNHTNAAIIYQCHDLHYLRLQRQAELTEDPILLDEANLFREKENYLFSASDALLTFSNLEEGIIKKGFPQKQVYTVPLFFYEEDPEPKHDFSKRRDLLYVGGFGHAPNRDAVQWFCQEVLPQVLCRVPDIVFNVVGANPPKEIAALSSANVKILGKVSEKKLQALYDSVKLSVIPLRFGAGVKGKVIETLYHAVPLVSTAIGLEGIAGIGQVATPKDDPEAFAAEILTLYQDGELWKKRSVLYAKFVADHFTEQKTAEQIREIFASAKAAAEERCNTAMASFEENPLRTIAFYLPQYHPIPENDEWWGKGFTEWRNVCKAKPLFAGHYQPHVPADLGFYDLRLEEARVAQADLAREYGIHGFCYYHYWFNGKRLLERPVEEMLVSGKPDFPFCLCWANENWTRRWDGQDSSILMEQVYSEADDRAHIQDLFRFFAGPRYIRVNGKPLFLVYRTENIPDPARTAEIWREEARKAGIGELYLVRVESIGRVNPHEIGFDAALEFAPDWDGMGSKVRSYAPADPELPEVVELPNEVYEKNHTHGYVELIGQMLKKEQPPYPWLRCVTPSWDNSARRSEEAVILLGSSPSIYQQWLENVINKTIVFNRPGERLVFVNAWNEWAEGNHLEPCIKWGRSYLEATKSGIENGLAMSPDDSSLSHQVPNLSTGETGKEENHEMAASLLKLIAEKKSSKSIIMSFENFTDLGNLTYFKGWAAINDNVSTEGTDIMILVRTPDGKARLIIPSKRKRPEITAHFENRCNYDFSGFEVMAKRIDPNDNMTVVIKRNGEMFWQAYRHAG